MKRFRHLVICGVVAVFLCVGGVDAADKTATWTGLGGNTNWSDPNNWDLIEVPINNVSDNFRVSIPGGFTVDLDVSGVSNILDFNLAPGATLRVQPGADITVLNAASISGTVNADNGGFTAVGTGTALTGNSGRVSLINNASVTIGGTSYASTGLPFSATLFSADGLGSSLNLSSLTSIDAGFNKNDLVQDAHVITATNGGVVDLSGVLTIDPPMGFADFLRIQLNDPSSRVFLTSLETTHIARGRTMFLMTNGAVLSLPGLLSVGNAHLFALSGARLTVAGPQQASYSSAGLPFNTDLLFANGVGSLLDLPSITSIDAGFDDNNRAARTHTISAINGGVIDLAGLRTITPPVRAEDWLRFELVDGSSEIRLPLLESINGAVGGRVMFALSNAANLSLPAMVTAQDVFFNLSSGAQLSMSGPGPVSYSSATFPFGTTLMVSDGAGTLLDLSSVTSLDAGFDDATAIQSIQTITATNGGVIDLSGVQVVTPPVRAEDAVRFDLNDSVSNISLTSLSTINGGGGGVEFVLSGGASLSLPALQTANNTIFNISGGSQMLVTGAQAVSYASRDLSFSSTLMVSDGAGTLLDLSSVTSLDAGFDDATTIQSTQTITATNGGVVNLSGLVSLTPPVRAEDRIRFDLNDSASNISLTSLSTINGGGGGVEFVLSGGASLSLPALQTANNTIFNISGGSQMLVTGAQAVSYASRDLSFSSTLMVSDGAGTLLDLSSVTSLDAGFDDATAIQSIQTITATNSGVIDLSGVQVITTPFGDDRIDVVIDNGGRVDLSSLQSVAPPVGGVGLLRFEVKASSLVIGPLSQAATAEFNLDKQATVTAPAGLAIGPGTSIHVELDGTQSSRLSVTGALILAGTLNIDLAAGYIPANQDQFQIIVADSRVGEFDQINGIPISQDLVWVPAYDFNSTVGLTLVAAIPGDATLDGAVNGDDLLLWQANLFLGNTFEQGDFNFDGVINGDDLLIWQAHLFEGVGVSGGAPNISAQVDSPEPSTLMTLYLGLLLTMGRVSRKADLLVSRSLATCG